MLSGLMALMLAESAVSETFAAMKKGVQVIAQGALAHQGWVGRADILRRVEVPSALGEWSYEAIDTKLARETKAGAVLQLCLYSDLLTQTQGVAPENMHVVAPWSDFQPRTLPLRRLCGLFPEGEARPAWRHSQKRRRKRPIPSPMRIAKYAGGEETCDKRRRDDDHLCLVAGISKVQINELKQRRHHDHAGAGRHGAAAGLEAGSRLVDSYSRVCEQARIQVEARESGERKHIAVASESGFGLTRLPEPSAGDIFLDLEGDPFVGEHGLEYLFGYQFRDEARPSRIQKRLGVHPRGRKARL